MTFGRFGVAILTLVLIAATSANAATITYSDRTAFESTLGFSATEDFEGFAVEHEFHTVPFDFGAFTVSMTGTPSTSYNFLDVAPAATSESDVNGTNGMRVFTDGDDTLVFTFDQAITAFGADFKNLNDSQSRTDVLAAGVLMTPGVVSLGSTSFFGFTSDTPFTTVTFDGRLNDTYGIDNVTYGQTPEPASLVLLGAGGLFLTFGAMRRRRRKASA